MSSIGNVTSILKSDQTKPAPILAPAISSNISSVSTTPVVGANLQQTPTVDTFETAQTSQAQPTTLVGSNAGVTPKKQDKPESRWRRWLDSVWFMIAPKLFGRR